MIAAVATVKNEVDILHATVSHMFAQGVDHIWVMDWYSTDGTRQSLEVWDPEYLTVVNGSPLPFYWSKQGDYIGRLADMAGAAGANWIVPFDADEYWTGTHGRSIKEALDTVSADRVQARILQYIGFDHRQLRVYPWTKVAFRYRPGLVVTAGNHSIAGGEGPAEEDALLVHEMKFQSYKHFIRKCQRRVLWSDEVAHNPSVGQPGLVIGGTRAATANNTIEELNEHWNWLWEEMEECSIPSEFRPNA